MDLEIIPNNDIADTIFFVDGKEQSIDSALSLVDGPIEDAKSGDFDSGFATIRSMTSFGRMVGWALAKLIHSMYVEWVAQGRDAERFWLRNQDETNLKRLTMERYIDAWNAKLGIPEEYSKLLLQQPIKNAIQLGSSMSQGFVPEEDDLKKLMSATSFSEFSDTLRGSTNREPRSGTLKLKLDMTTGDITAWMNGERKVVGYLNVQEIEESDICNKAITRISRSAGLIKE